MLESTKRGVYTNMTKEILLSQGKVALVDDADFARLSLFKWHKFEHGKTTYVITRCKMSGRRKIYIHSLIMPASKGFEIDHINGNGLDNRRENLRVVTHRENMQNRHVPKSSKYPGVNWNKNAKMWQSLICINRKTRHLGYFLDEWEAFHEHDVAMKTLDWIYIEV